jgi:hypothetical protein
MTTHAQSLTTQYRQRTHAPDPLAGTIAELLTLATPPHLAAIITHAEHDAPWLAALATGELARRVPSLHERLALIAEARGSDALATIHRDMAGHAPGGDDA